MHGRFQFFTIFILVVAFANGVQAETPKPEPSTAAKPGAVAGANAIPGPRQLNLLIRTTVIAFNQANQTGNYSVLRDLSAPVFQAANTPAKLAVIFAKIRNRKLNLSPILFFDPKLIRKPVIQPSGLLRLSGFFDTRPERVVFDLQFQRINTNWRLFGISIETRVAEDAAQAPQAKTTPKKKSGSGSPKKKPKTTKNNRSKPIVKKKN